MHHFFPPWFACLTKVQNVYFKKLSLSCPPPQVLKFTITIVADNIGFCKIYHNISFEETYLNVNS